MKMRVQCLFNQEDLKESPLIHREQYGSSQRRNPGFHNGDSYN